MRRAPGLSWNCMVLSVYSCYAYNWHALPPYRLNCHLLSPGDQYKWYYLYDKCKSLPSARMNFNYLCRFGVDELFEIQIYFVSWPISRKQRVQVIQTIYNELSYTIYSPAYSVIFRHILRHRKDVLSSLLVPPHHHHHHPHPHPQHISRDVIAILQWPKTFMPSASTSLCKLDQSIEFGYLFRWKFGTHTPNLTEISRHIIAYINCKNTLTVAHATTTY